MSIISRFSPFFRFRFGLSVIAWLIALSSLAALGADPVAAKARKSGGARLTLTRTTDVLYFAATAIVRVNGKQVASLGRGESATVTIAPGANKVAVDAFLQPGSFVLDLHARPGGNYAIEISPRGESYASVVVFGLAGVLIDAAANNNKAGAFKLQRAR